MSFILTGDMVKYYEMIAFNAIEIGAKKWILK